MLSLLCLTASAASARIVSLSGTTYTKHFIIHHRSDSRSNAQVVGEASELWYREISSRLHITKPLLQPIPMYLYRNQKDFSDATGYEKPGHALGRASTKGYIDLDSSGIFAPAGQVAGHEIVHVLIFHILEGDANLLPLWMNEGAAKFMTKDWDTVDATILADAATDGSLMPLSTLNHRFPNGPRETLAYTESASAVRYIVDKYGEKSLAELIHKTAETRSFEKAMIDVTGVSVSEFEQKWQRSVEGYHPVLQIIRTVAVIGGLVMPLLAIAAYLALRRRKQRIIDQYEQDEWEEANWKDWGGGS
ncbi:MAG: peptidase MA family metallohydrolase [Armatimonadota bacterium]